MDGYYLDSSSNVCTTCSTGCAECLSSTGCVKCADGYTTTETSASGTAGFTCEACTGRCATCLGTTNKCTSCVSGYTLKGWKCIKSFRFTFGLVLTTTKAIFYKRFIIFLRIIALALNPSATTSESITISTISFGSVIVGGSGDPNSDSGSSQSAQDFANIAAILGVNGNIAGMSIASSTISTTGGTLGSTETNSSLGLILGICIPVGLLVLVGIGLFIYTKRHSFMDKTYQY